jgi:hypothetical protein
MAWWDWASIIFGAFGTVAGVICIIIAVRQSRAMRDQRSTYKEKCSTRYKDLAETTTSLSEKILASCETVNKVCIKKSVPCRILSTNINAVMSITRDLHRFCRRLDEEFVADFNEHIDLEISNQLDDLSCHCIEQPQPE